MVAGHRADQDVSQFSGKLAGAPDSLPLSDEQRAWLREDGAAVGYLEWECTGCAPAEVADRWHDLVAAQPMLRATVNGSVIEVPPTAGNGGQAEVVDLSGVATSELAERLARRRADLLGAPDGPARLRLLTLPDGRVRLQLRVHPLLVDRPSLYQHVVPALVGPTATGPAQPAGATGPAVDDGFDGGPDGDEAVRYWRAFAAHLPAEPRLPRPRQASAPASPGADYLQRTVDRRTWQSLTQRCSALGITPSHLLLAAFAEVLRDWSQTSAFTLGLLVPEPAPDSQAGYRTATVPVAVNGTGPDWAARLRELDSQLRQNRLHRHGLAAWSGGGALPVVVTDLTELALPVADGQVYARHRLPGVLLNLLLRCGRDGLVCALDIEATDLPAGLPEDLFDTYLRLLTTLAEDDSAWQESRFDLLPARHRELINAVNDTAAEVPGTLLHEWLFDRAEQQPDAPAVLDSRRRLSYRELADYAARIGARLRAADDVRPGELVAIVMDKGWEQYAGVYGALAAGAGYLPIDATVPPARLQSLLRSGKVLIALTQAHLDDRLSWPEGLRRYRVDEDFESGPTDRLPSAQSQTDLAYVIFTSGSTGVPKGVAVDHRAVVNLITDVNARFSITPQDRAFGISALHFDASIFDVFGPIAAGASVVLPDPFRRAQPDRWVERVHAEQVTIWNSVPALMEMMVGHAEIRTDRPLGSLRLAVLSGDWIPLTLPDRLRAQADGIAVIGSGGPTETICWSLFYPIGEVDPGWTSIPYGKAISNQRYYIVDEDLRVRPLWVPGEMAVASEVGLAQGYWADAQRTAEKFVQLPGGGRAYLTGDIGRLLPDGNIEILGRDDFQVKIQGYRIELGEIEAALRACPGVEAAVVVAPESGAGVRRLHGFVVGAPSDPPQPDALRSALRQTLPSYLVPAGITVLDRLPLTGNGKVDRLRLIALANGALEDSTGPAVEPVGQSAEQTHVEPVTAVERVVCAVVADILGLKQVGRTDNFFHLGGDSLSGMRLGKALSGLLETPLSLRVILDNPDLGQLAQALSSDPASGADVVRAAEKLDRLVEQQAALAR